MGSVGWYFNSWLGFLKILGDGKKNTRKNWTYDASQKKPPKPMPPPITGPHPYCYGQTKPKK